MNGKEHRIKDLTNQIERRAEALKANPVTWRDRQNAEALLKDIEQRAQLLRVEPNEKEEK